MGGAEHERGAAQLLLGPGQGVEEEDEEEEGGDEVSNVIHLKQLSQSSDSLPQHHLEP